MDKESKLELQKIDCNCNDCFYFKRDIEKSKRLNNNDKIKTCKIHYGGCSNPNRAITDKSIIDNVSLVKNINVDGDTFAVVDVAQIAVIANMCLLGTQECFLHRKDGINEK